ncbi:soma ferritin-like [Patiria miniata]|uniref:Ferritin n=1 Tax=Patiria miniata TaxID=46514 RepID=A0A913ZSW4_PATMI|nr:soma ferritin-like [Patiria miniata]
MDTANLIRQNFPRDCESGLNRQINLQLHGSYVYLAMVYHFDRSDVALEGFRKFSKKLSDRKREVAANLMAYQNKRGGQVCLQDIKAPTQDYSTSQKAIESALQMEKDVNQALLDLFNLATKNGDEQFALFIEDYLHEQTDCIKDLGDHLANILRTGPNLGEFLFDKESLHC